MEKNENGKNILREEFIFKDEFFLSLEEEKNKCIRSILWTAEVILKDKNNEEFIKLRKSVLDSVNDFFRRIHTKTDKVI